MEVGRTRIGYPCINLSIGCTPASGFRLAHYSERRLLSTVASNLSCLQKILLWNAERGLLFFRISSDTVPFASHPVCDVRWWRVFGSELRELGDFIRKKCMRISMHPDQFVLLNSPRPSVVRNSVAELVYHARLLDAMGLGEDAKVQIHSGGLYGDREGALRRFAEAFLCLPEEVRRRLAVENDDRLFGIQDVMELHRRTGAPVLLDVFHHETMERGNGRVEGPRAALELAAATWRRADGPPMVDYSSQEPGARPGAHARTLDAAHFSAFLRSTAGMRYDLMLEIKDKERSAIRALALLGTLPPSPTSKSTRSSRASHSSSSPALFSKALNQHTMLCEHLHNGVAI
ncbi:MAG: UV DNA damage repair endonuclease UvsE [Thermoplasmata archaeon]